MSIPLDLDAAGVVIGLAGHGEPRKRYVAMAVEGEPSDGCTFLCADCDACDDCEDCDD